MRHYGGCTDRWSAERQADRDARSDVRQHYHASSSDREPYDCGDANRAYRDAYDAAARSERVREDERQQEQAYLEQMEREMYAAAEERQTLEDAEIREQYESDALDEELPF